jgi:hypothetical protein
VAGAGRGSGGGGRRGGGPPKDVWDQVYCETSFDAHNVVNLHDGMITIKDSPRG